MSVTLTFAFLSPVRRAAEAARSLARATLDVALPPLCAACRVPVDGKGLCPSCWSRLSFITRPYCERLGIPFAFDPGPGALSMEAIASPPAYNRARAAVRFDDVSRALVHALRWANRSLGADDGTLDRPCRPRIACRGRRARPGAAALAAAMGAALQPVGHAGGGRFSRERGAHRPPRARASKPPPSRSASRAPSAPPMSRAPLRVSEDGRAAVFRRRLVLVDDVLTSGATVEGCARALLRAGAANVDVLVFARVADPGRTSI